MRFKVSSPLTISIAQISYSSVGVGWTERKWVTVPAVESGNGWYMVEVPAKELKQPFDCFATISDSRPVSVSSYLIRYE